MFVNEFLIPILSAQLLVVPCRVLKILKQIKQSEMVWEN